MDSKFFFSLFALLPRNAGRCWLALTGGAVMRIGLVMSCSKVPVTVGMVVISRLGGCGQL